MTINLTPGYVAHHAPGGRSTQGREAALIDIAQDLVLREIHLAGLLEYLVFKGGTALRKLFAGKEGRFSLDLDFSVAEIDQDVDGIMAMLEDHLAGLELGPFRYDIEQRRGKLILLIRSDQYGMSGQLGSELDISPPPWIPPETRGWIPMPIHDRYGDPSLPELRVMKLEENLAEKIARLNRVTPARDMYDLAWVYENYLRKGDINTELVRRLAVLRIWVDGHGVTSSLGARWKPGHEASEFDVDRWLRLRTATEYDQQDIGILAVPSPDLADLARTVQSGFSFLADLDSDETQVAAVRGQDRALVLSMLEDLPGARLRDTGLY